MELTEKDLARQTCLPFNITTNELINIIDCYRNRKVAEEIDIVLKHGGLQEFENLLSVDFSLGLTGTDFVQRKLIFGRNKKKKAKEKTFFDFVKDAISDKILVILLFTGGLSLVLGLALEEDHRSYSWIEGFSIILAVFLVVTVTSVNDYQKSKKFKSLQDSYSNRQNITIFRSGSYMSMHPDKVLVGDIIEISDGNIIPVDGILIEASNVEVDESAMTGENDKVIKASFKDAVNIKNEISQDKSEQISHHSIPSPVCISGTTLAEGRGKLLVLCIGENSVEGRVSSLSSQDQPETPLQLKLTKVADFITKIGLVCAGIAVFALFLRFFIELGIGNEKWDNGQYKHMVEFLIIGLTILVVAIPEGLPLAVTISLAYSVNKMQKENNLVKRFYACETMGTADMICSDKTGTLTTNNMTVEYYWMERGKIVPDFHKHFSMYPEYFAKLKENICVNTNARIEDSKEVGSKTEIALLKMLIKFGHDDYTQIRNKFKRRPGKVFPFSSSRKRSSIIISLDDEGLKKRAHMMGASEVVFSKCSYLLLSDGSYRGITSEDREYGEKCIKEMAEDGLRTICLCYKDVPENCDYTLINNSLPEIEEKSFICLGIVGIKDPVRAEVPAAVEKCKKAGVKVRMVTGDNKITAKAIAKECGIISNEQSLVMEGSEFREIVGGTICSTCLTEICPCARDSSKAEPGQLIRKDTVKNLEGFKKIIYNLDVLARSQPEDKYTLVTGLMQIGHVVAVTGDGTNDAPALKKADIGFAMGIAGTELARDAAGIILLDDNFSSIISAVLWGRNIYDNIQRFIQFQLTINIVAVTCAIVGAVTIKQSPLTAVQMLWVNLIMDTFASLALATQPPTQDMLERAPVSKNVSIVTKLMWKNILGQAFLELCVIFPLVYAGEMYLIEDGNSSLESVKKHNDYYVVSGRLYHLDGTKDYKGYFDDPDIGPSRHFTYIFNIFVLMQLFNQFNARKIKDEINVFGGIKQCPMFVIIWFVTFGFQILMVEIGSYAFSCHKLGLTGAQWVISFAFGLTTFFWRFVLLTLPSKYFKDWAAKPRSPDEGPGITSFLRRNSENSIKKIHPET